MSWVAEAKAVIGLGAMRLQDLADRLADIEAAHEDFHLACDELPDNRAEIVATGVNAHGAMPHLGVNAAGMLLIALKELNAGSATAAGGGSKNAYLCQLMADRCGIPVVTASKEGTALGNVMMQAKATGLVSDIWEMRRLIASAVEMQTYEPAADKAAWDAAYERYLGILEMKK
mgnify:CR=1 FL=1